MALRFWSPVCGLQSVWYCHRMCGLHDDSMLSDLDWQDLIASVAASGIRHVMDPDTWTYTPSYPLSTCISP
ncbi:uncharacterized protein MYCFIDRAFT_170404 [Pseudocercospora fijiensis CIRAD86]|uniref:Uncharacterized protein n=1 Tax=Pseudocercospora fijiensis (strain CIRAD86) TaxID=383855 RepID=N1Q7U6_PSEFD|nr:uncharacterized protein MYCFIDRAFT_170404 [Pseudocercospora fijiensis CIRAD86]EME88835.1 hypothetical protein MYCFIDRAFT_170404 [Pseudocercospora fijiensis CIRAD86]